MNHPVATVTAICLASGFIGGLITLMATEHWDSSAEVKSATALGALFGPLTIIGFLLYWIYRGLTIILKDFVVGFPILFRRFFPKKVRLPKASIHGRE